MAFFNMYLIAGGTGSADINAGTSIGAAQAAATTGGNWNSGTGVFIAASGTPFAATVVGDYASVYNDGATVTGFVGKVTTVTSSTQITVDVATLKYGQNIPTTSANARSCVINGSWNTEQVLAAGGLATFTVPQATKINIKGNLTITASRTISMAGAATTPLWFSCYNTTPGDLDSDTTNTLAKPIWTLNATFVLSTTGALQLWSGLSVVGNRSATAWNSTGSGIFIYRCRAENTSSNAAAIAFTTGTNSAQIYYSWFKTPTTATTTGTVSNGVAGCTWVGCIFEGGGIAGVNCAATNANFYNCIGLSNTGAGFLASTGFMKIIGCTVYGATVDGVKWTGTPTVGSCVISCIFSGLNGSTATTNGVNNASGTNTCNVTRACNTYYNVTNPEVGFGDFPAIFGQTDSNPIVLSATNLTPVPTSNARNNGFPGIFENETYSNFDYIGAVQPLGTGGFFIQ